MGLNLGRIRQAALMVSNYGTILIALPLAFCLTLVEGWRDSQSSQASLSHSRSLALQNLSNELDSRANLLKTGFLTAEGCWQANGQSMEQFKALANPLLSHFPEIQSLYWLHLDSATATVTIQQSMSRTNQPITSVKLDQRPSFRFALQQPTNSPGITASHRILLPFYYTPTYGHLLLPQQKLSLQCDILMAELNAETLLHQAISSQANFLPEGSYSLSDPSPIHGNSLLARWENRSDSASKPLSEANALPLTPDPKAEYLNLNQEFLGQNWSIEFRPPLELGSSSWLDPLHLIIALLILMGAIRCLQQCLTIRRIPSLKEFKQMIFNHQAANHLYGQQIVELESRIQELKSKMERERTPPSDSSTNSILPPTLTAKELHDEQIMTLRRIVAGVAHEINTPLGVALTATSVVEKQIQKVSDLLDSKATTQLDPEVAIQLSLVEKNLKICRDASQHIKPTIQRASTLIQNLKQISTAPQLAPARWVNLSLVITEIMNSLKYEIRRAGHRLRLDLPEELMIATRPDSLWQVLSNLSQNAINHGFKEGEQGTITIKAFQNPQDKNLGAIIEFSDNGRGIPPEIGKKIFEPFFTTSRHKGGSGLGLSIVVSLLLQSLEGTIDYINLEPQGTRFILTLGNVKDDNVDLGEFTDFSPTPVIPKPFD